MGPREAKAFYAERAQPVEVTEELVGTVDEVNDHFGINVRFPGSALKGYYRGHFPRCNLSQSAFLSPLSLANVPRSR